MTHQPRLLFIGAGNIAQSIMKGIIRAQPSTEILATAPTTKNLNLIQETLGCKTSLLNNIHSVLPEFNPDLIFLCVKPQVLVASIRKRDQLTNLVRSLPHKCVVLSLLAGIKSHVLSSAFNLPEHNIIRLMLNTAAKIQASSVFYYTHPQVQPTMLHNVHELLRLIGQPVVKLSDENLMDVATGICGSGPAFFYEAVQAACDCSVRNGLTRADSLKVVAQLCISTGQMLLSENAHPYQLRDEVASPAGTTMYGLQKWHDQLTGQKIDQSFQAAIDRARELSSTLESKLDEL